MIEQSLFDLPVIAFVVVWRDATLIHPIKMDSISLRINGLVRKSANS
jgi:hypothetical protein